MLRETVAKTIFMQGHGGYNYIVLNSLRTAVIVTVKTTLIQS